MSRADLSGLRTFLTIVEFGTLRAAGDELGVNPSAVSQQLKAFEEALGSALLVRTTRSLALTDIGQALYERTNHLMGEVDAALDATRRMSRSASGQLRITLPYRAWQLALAPRIAAFQDRFPDIDLDLSIDEELKDVVSNGYHAGIRLGDYLTEEMIAVALTKTLDGAFVASNDYLKNQGVPREPADLLRHECIRYRQISSGKVAPWLFDVNGTETRIDVSGRLTFSDLRSVIDAASQGLGIGWSLRDGVLAQIESGELIEVLRNYTPHRPRFYLYFPRQLKNMPSLRAFIEHFAIGA